MGKGIECFAELLGSKEIPLRRIREKGDADGITISTIQPTSNTHPKKSGHHGQIQGGDHHDIPNSRWGGRSRIPGSVLRARFLGSFEE